MSFDMSHALYHTCVVIIIVLTRWWCRRKGVATTVCTVTSTLIPAITGQVIYGRMYTHSSIACKTIEIRYKISKIHCTYIRPIKPVQTSPELVLKISLSCRIEDRTHLRTGKTGTMVLARPVLVLVQSLVLSSPEDWTFKHYKSGS